MRNNKGNNNNDKTGDVISWIIVLILMLIPITAPIGWILLFVKLGILGKKKVNNNKKSKQKRSRLDKKTGKGLSLFLLLVSIGLFMSGIGRIIPMLSGGFINLFDLTWGVSYILGAAAAFFSRNIVSHRFSRYKNYYAFIDGRGIVPIYEIEQISGVSYKTVIRDLQAMINNGYLEQGAYIDNDLECLVLSAEAANKMRESIKDTQTAAQQPDEVPLDQYAASLAELREVTAYIKNEEISKKASRLEELTEKIFKIVEDNPQKVSQLRRFMSYYLPTTLKLLRSYATLEKQGVKGENIMSTKKSIGDILDTLSTGFEQQLDQLFKSDAIDIAADINVLENLMQQDGLTENKSEFQVAEGGF